MPDNFRPDFESLENDFVRDMPIHTIDKQSLEAIKRAFQDTAPLYEAERVLQDNGIAYGYSGFDYRFLDMRPETRGTPIQERRTTYSEALAYALKVAKTNIQAEAIARYYEEGAKPQLFVVQDEDGGSVDAKEES